MNITKNKTIHDKIIKLDKKVINIENFFSKRIKHINPEITTQKHYIYIKKHSRNFSQDNSMIKLNKKLNHSKSFDKLHKNQIQIQIPQHNYKNELTSSKQVTTLTPNVRNVPLPNNEMYSFGENNSNKKDEPGSNDNDNTNNTNNCNNSNNNKVQQHQWNEKIMLCQQENYMINPSSYTNTKNVSLTNESTTPKKIATTMQQQHRVLSTENSQLELDNNNTNTNSNNICSYNDIQNSNNNTHNNTCTNTNTNNNNTYSKLATPITSPIYINYNVLFPEHLQTPKTTTHHHHHHKSSHSHLQSATPVGCINDKIIFNGINLTMLNTPQKRKKSFINNVNININDINFITPTNQKTNKKFETSNSYLNLPNKFNLASLNTQKEKIFFSPSFLKNDKSSIVKYKGLLNTHVNINSSSNNSNNNTNNNVNACKKGSLIKQLQDKHHKTKSFCLFNASQGSYNKNYITNVSGNACCSGNNKTSVICPANGIIMNSINNEDVNVKRKTQVGGSHVKHNSNNNSIIRNYHIKRK